MRVIFYVLLALFATASLSSCGTKGRLKTPTQMEQQEQKKAKKEAEEKAKAEKEAKEKAAQSTPTETK